MKYLLLTLMVAISATPAVEHLDPYSEYDVLMDKTQDNIALTKSSIETAQKMTAEKVVAVQKEVKEMEAVAEKVELMEKACFMFKVEIPKDLNDLERIETERIADSIRVSNMQKLNKI